MTHDEMAAVLREAGWRVEPPEDPHPATTAGKLREQAAGVRYGCHVDCGFGEPVAEDCVLDYDAPSECRLAGRRRKRETCEFWKRWPEEKRVSGEVA